MDTQLKHFFIDDSFKTESIDLINIQNKMGNSAEKEKIERINGSKYFYRIEEYLERYGR